MPSLYCRAFFSRITDVSRCSRGRRSDTHWGGQNDLSRGAQLSHFKLCCNRKRAASLSLVSHAPDHKLVCDVNRRCSWLTGWKSEMVPLTKANIHFPSLVFFLLDHIKTSMCHWPAPVMKCSMWDGNQYNICTCCVRTVPGLTADAIIGAASGRTICLLLIRIGLERLHHTSPLRMMNSASLTTPVKH